MADGTVLNTGVGGDTIATDDIGGVKHQMVKLEYGALDSATLVSPANPLPVVQTGAAQDATLTSGSLRNKDIILTDPVVTSSLSSVAADTGVPVSNSRFAKITVSGTYTGAAIIWEVSPDNTNWYTTTIRQTGSSTVGGGSAYTLATNQTVNFDVDVSGWSFVRGRLTAWSSGTVNIQYRPHSSALIMGVHGIVSATATGQVGNGVALSGNPVRIGGSDGTTTRDIKTDANGNLSMLITDGTNIASVTAGDAGFNGQVTTQGRKTFTLTTSIAGAQTLGANTDVRGYSYITIDWTSVGVGLALTGPQFAPTSGGNYITSTNWANANVAGSAQTSLGILTTVRYGAPITGNFFQIVISALTSGTATAVVTLWTSIPSVSLQRVSTFGNAGAIVDAVLGATRPPNALQMGGSDGTNIQTPRTAVDNADAIAVNATADQLNVQSRGYVFNGTSWDRQRSGVSVATTTGDTGAKVATGNGATQTNVGSNGLDLFIVLGTVSGTTPTCVFKLQGSVDGGTNWYDIPGAATASLIASTNVGISIYPSLATTVGSVTTGTIATASQALPRTWRVVWTIGGTTPSFAITSITYNYHA